MVLGTSHYISCIKYGTLEFIPPTHEDVMTEIYVEEFKRHNTLIIVVTFFLNSEEERLQRIYMKKTEEGISSVTRQQKNEFVAGPIFLTMNAGCISLHPTVDIRTITSEDQPLNFQYIGNTFNERDDISRSHLWSNDGKYFMSPIVNVDDTQVTNGTKSSLIGHITGYSMGVEDDMIIINVEDTEDLEYEVYLPVNLEGIVSAANILDYPFTVINARPNPIDLRQIEVNIDISDTGPQGPNVITLANLRRCEYLYTQHSILPIHKAENIATRVYNSELDCHIYEVNDDEFVTFVEVFNHHRNYFQYVVVNTRKLADPDAVDSKRIFYLTFNPRYSAYNEVTAEQKDFVLKRIYKMWPQIPSWGFLSRLWELVRGSSLYHNIVDS
ncbi:spherical body protein, putative [Babesia ovis]|uniref:Spherical body protein, putative n=1 Tax=Babesia ovis TaxID=5869 RepID=A0A9W5TD55_BABOV|nr:spherical body protein, putative [Babesia ovis]